MRQQRLFTITLFLVFIMSGFSNVSNVYGENHMLTINLDDTQQEFMGFGASGAWWAQDVGGCEEANRSRIIELLFNQETGIGLSVYRYNIGGGAQRIIDPWRRSETFETAPGEYDWSQDTNAMWVLHAVHDAGVEQFIAFANSPTGRMTISGQATGGIDGTSNLPENMYNDFAQYLVDVVRYLREDESIPTGWVSPINEPQWDWQASKGQEGNHYTTTEIVGVLRALVATIEEEELDVRVSAVEAGEWGDAVIYARRIFENPVLAESLDHFAVHSYWSTPDDKERFTRYMCHNGAVSWNIREIVVS